MLIFRFGIRIARAIMARGTITAGQMESAFRVGGALWPHIAIRLDAARPAFASSAGTERPGGAI